MVVFKEFPHPVDNILEIAHKNMLGVGNSTIFAFSQHQNGPHNLPSGPHSEDILIDQQCR